MPKITDELSFGAASEKITPLGLTPLYDELWQIAGSFQLRVEEKKDGNGSAEVRAMFDAAFTATGAWRERHIGEGYQMFPILVLGVEHDGAGPALPKREKKSKRHPTAPE